ncbi:MAG: outer membrane beta-barrel protein [Bacteroidota bacterium]
MKRLILFLAFCSMVVFSASAQKEQTVFGKTGLRLTGAWGGPATNISKIGNENVYFRGGFGGLEFNRSVFLGWASYTLQDEIIQGLPVDRLQMRYRGPMIGYAVQPNKTVHPKFMMMVGPGHVEVNDEGVRDKILVLKPSVGLGINIFRWLHMDLEGGYRFVSDTEQPSLSDDDLSNFYAGIKFKFGFSW